MNNGIARLLTVSSWIEIWKRLEESRYCMIDVFVGNYLFMQVDLSPLGPSREASSLGS